MASLIPGRTRVLARLFTFIAALLLVFSAFGQSPSCNFSVSAAIVHQEGLAERVGDIVLTCSGGAPGPVSLSLYATLNTNITNRLDADGNPQAITVSGATVGSIRLSSATTLALNGISYTAPATTTITISGIRAAVASLSNGSGTAVISASIIGVGAQFGSGQLVVAVSSPTLLSSVVNSGVPCNGSPLPGTLDFNSFLSTSLSSTVRITEATAKAFTKKDSGADTGLRFLVNLAGYGAGARVFVPDAIVGNSGTQLTSAGAFASTRGAGVYTPGGNGQLLLVRVNGADANGAGGNLAIQTPGVATTFGSMTEVSLANGAGSVAYEVVDSNAALQESAQIPVFVVVNATNCPSTLNPVLTARLAPVSAVSIATPADPIPRYVSVTPGLDCQVQGDCGAVYFPKLSVDTTPIALTGSSLGGAESAYVKVGVSGSGIINFSSSVAYQTGSNWLTISPSSGSNSTTLQIIANPGSLDPGTYQATVTVSAGSYGSGAIPVTFTVGPVGVTIQNVGNAASFQYGAVAPGSYAVIFGLNMAGKNVSATFNGLPATIIYKSATQINLIVPSTLAGQQGASVIVTADGVASNPFKVTLAENVPGIFKPGIVNFDDASINDVTHPAARGKYVLVFLTGLTIPLTGQVTVNIGGQTNLIPSFAGAQPTLPALDQVNITVPTSLPVTPNPVPLQVCIPGPTGQQVCSNQVDLYVQQ